MCGIVAAVGCTLQRPLDAELQTRTAELRHRGPDSWGTWVCGCGTAGVGAARLAIVGVDNGAQPIVAGSAALVCNGEIYNHGSLPGPRSTESDVEAVLCLWRAQQHPGHKSLEAVCAMLDGVFSFVIVQEGRLWAARDRIGVKPLYMLTDEASGEVWFASEVAALHGLNGALESVPAGCCWASGSGLHRWHFPLWRSTVGSTLPVPTVIREQLSIAVAKRIPAEVPVGVLLSGGLDSTIVAFLMTSLLPSKVRSFAIGAPDSPDMVAARTVAFALGLEHCEVHLDIQQAIELIPTCVRHLANSSPALLADAVPQLLLYRAVAAAGVKVVLTGEGADELFGGYRCFGAVRDGLAIHQGCAHMVGELQHSQLLRVDRMSMAAGVEARVPFLDADCLELFMSFSGESKLWYQQDGSARPEKAILREAFRGLLPDSVVDRPKLAARQGYSSGWLPAMQAELAAKGGTVYLERLVAEATGRQATNPDRRTKLIDLVSPECSAFRESIIGDSGPSGMADDWLGDVDAPPCTSTNGTVIVAQKLVLDVCAAVCGWTPDQMDNTLSAQGVDSLDLMTVRSQLNKLCRLELAVALMEHGTVHCIAVEVAKKLDSRTHPTSADAAPSHSQVILERDARKPTINLEPLGGLTACAAGDLAGAKALHQTGWEPAYAVDKWGTNSLMWAAISGSVECCQLLHEWGLDFTVCNHAGHGFVIKAAWRGLRAVLEWAILDPDGPLLGDQLQLKEARGVTASELALVNGHAIVAEWLDSLLLK